MLVSACCHLPVLDPQPTTESRKSGPDLSAWREGLGTRLSSLRIEGTAEVEAHQQAPRGLRASWSWPVPPWSWYLWPGTRCRSGPSIWDGPVPQAVAVRRLAVHCCPGCRPWGIQGRSLGMPQKGFKLVPPSCSGMISFGQLDCPSEKGPAGQKSRGRNGEDWANAPRRNSARVLHSWRRLASAAAGWRGLAEVECARLYDTISLHTIHRKGRLAKRSDRSHEEIVSGQTERRVHP